MTGATRGGHAARGHRARLVVAVAVFLGLALAVGFQCASGMATAASAPQRCAAQVPMASAPGVSPERAEPMVIGPQVAAACVAPVAAGGAGAGDGSPGSQGLGGVLMICLTFIVAVVAAVAGLRPTGPRSVVRMVRSAPVLVIRVIQPRAPSLAELCLLRT